ncbi:MAG: aminotransferase class I/II-fold pyridoxal phosphate-dependent enzyme, partial [Tidjanibacter sp.]|nr:aminotransferase class I/II-fold pyridoxal phosphate-dependent enzyme [Tidjanibacter sp.]
KRHDLYLICDEVYREFCYDGKEHYSVMKLKGLERNVILIDSASKRYSMCGVRIGALVTRNEDVTEAALKFAQARLSPPLLGQIAVEAAHDIDADYFHRVHDEYVARRNTLVEGLNSIEGVYSPMPTGAFYTMVRLPIDDCDRFARWLLEEFRVNNTTVMIAPGSGFYNTMGEGRNQARLAYVLCQEDLREAVEILRQALAVYPGRTNR